MFFPKDFIETAEGLIFAVVAQGLENEKVRCFLRYVRHENGSWHKVQTAEANALLAKKYPDYCFHSLEFDAFLHAVSTEKIIKRHQPAKRLQQLVSNSPRDEIEQNCVQLCALLQQAGIDLAHFGVTGSLLIGQQKATSDIDLVCYDLTTFHKCRETVRNLIEQQVLTDLTSDDWRDSFERRDCELSFEDYVWHERRKANKGMINGRKFDLSLVEKFSLVATQKQTIYKKLGKMTIRAEVVDSCRAFCYPAEFKLLHPTIQTVACFTATYIGQAVVGETIEISGQLEQDAFGNQRIVVGSSREARGEYIATVENKRTKKIIRITPS